MIWIIVILVLTELLYKPRLDVLVNGDWVLWYNKQITKHTYERAFIHLNPNKNI